MQSDLQKICSLGLTPSLEVGGPAGPHCQAGLSCRGWGPGALGLVVGGFGSEKLAQPWAVWGVVGGQSPFIPFTAEQLPLLFLTFQPQTNCGGRVSVAQLPLALSVCLAGSSPQPVSPCHPISACLALAPHEEVRLSCLWRALLGGPARAAGEGTGDLGLGCRAQGCLHGHSWP